MKLQRGSEQSTALCYLAPGRPYFSAMHLFYDQRDDASHEARGSKVLYWLDDLDARPLCQAKADDTGFVFAGARPIDDYRRLTTKYTAIRDRPDERAPLLRLDDVLDAMTRAGVDDVPSPRTWRLPLDAELPADLTFPLFVRTAFSSLKLGGHISKVRTRAQLESEMRELRRALGWDALILARAWCELAPAGRSVYGPVPQEVRTWIVDGTPHAWSFHYLNVVAEPQGFPPSAADLQTLKSLARRVGSVFSSRLVVADFARDARGDWIFIEAGPGSCAGTAHEQVFKSVASLLCGAHDSFTSDATGGVFGGAG